jgi:RimJ/RimL family protein N-acetyltransferase
MMRDELVLRPPVVAPCDRLELRDGTPVDVRAMRPDDAEALVRFHSSLSAETTYLRFFSIHPLLSDSEVERFTHVDHRDRDALVASIAGEIVGVARFDRLDSPTDAEVAFVVADEWQGRGLGSALFARLADLARSVGVCRFVADTLRHNRRMLKVFLHCDLPVTVTYDQVTRLVVDLGPESPSERTIGAEMESGRTIRCG